MAVYEASDNIYWAFSSSAQAIAAFIGFLSAGYFFSHDRMDKKVEKDETLREIYTDIKAQHFKKLSSLLWLTGFSIILSLLVVFINGFDTGIFLPLFATFVSLLNAYTVLRAVILVIAMVDPKNVAKTADKLIKESTGEAIDSRTEKGMRRGEFLEKFIELEKLALQLVEKKSYNVFIDRKNQKNIGFEAMVRELLLQDIINTSEFNRLNRISRIRNLIAHGRRDSVGIKESQELIRLIDMFKSLL